METRSYGATEKEMENCGFLVEPRRGRLGLHEHWWLQDGRLEIGRSFPQQIHRRRSWGILEGLRLIARLRRGEPRA